MEETTSRDNCSFVKAGTVHDNNSDGHMHESVHHHEHGHTHEVMDTPGSYTDRDKPIYRTDWNKRAFTVGIGGPVGSGKTALVLALCRHLRDRHSICVITNDIFTSEISPNRTPWGPPRVSGFERFHCTFSREDWEFLVKNDALPEERMRAVETGGCPHAAIREDFSLNLEESKELTQQFNPELIIIESGGDNLAANFSRELADYIIYVIDVAGGDKVPRKGGPGITQSDMLVINKTDLAEAVGADLKVMSRDAGLMRQGGPTIFAQAKHMMGIPDIAEHVIRSYKQATCSA